MRRIGLRLQILLTLTVAVVVGLGLVYLFAARVQTATLREERARQAHTLATVLARSLERGAEGEAPEELLRRLDLVAEAAGAEAAILLDRLGEPALASQRPQLGLLVDAEVLRASGGTRAITSAYVGTGAAERLLVRASVELPDQDLRVADLLLVMPTRHIRERVELIDRLVFLFAAVVLLFIVVIGHLVLTRLVVAPVRRVIRSMERFHATEVEGSSALGFEVGPALPDPEGNEVDVLATTFNRLSARLKDATTRHQAQLREARELNRRLQDAHGSLVRSEKLASVGLLTAGIAHEIGNPISIILGYVELMQRDDCTPDELRDYTGQIDAAARRVNVIIKDLLDFSRPTSATSATADACDVARRSLKLLAPQKRFRSVKASTIFEAPSIRVRIDDGRLQQVLVNLLLNAADAMDGAGQVTVRVWRDGDKALVEVADRGPGIPEEHLIRIFDPFFSTKGPGAGTGLGLSICHTIVTTYGGDIRVRSTPRDGTSFVVELPCAPDDPADAAGDIA